MRHSRVWAIFAVITVLFAAGCGGGGGGTSSTTSVEGFWLGTSTAKGVTGTSSTFQAGFVQNGTTITGNAVMNGSITNGTVIGTINGKQVTVTITIPAVNAALRTDSQYGYNTPSFYNTNAPMDLSKPITVIVGGVVLPTDQYTVATAVSALYSNQIYIPVTVPSTVTVKITYYPYDPNPGVGSTTNLTGTVSGTSITGTYTSVTTSTTSSTSTTQTGTFVLTRPDQDPPVHVASLAAGGGSNGK